MLGFPTGPADRPEHLDRHHRGPPAHRNRGSRTGAVRPRRPGWHADALAGVGQLLARRGQTDHAVTTPGRVLGERRPTATDLADRAVPVTAPVISACAHCAAAPESVPSAVEHRGRVGHPASSHSRRSRYRGRSGPRYCAGCRHGVLRFSRCCSVLTAVPQGWRSPCSRRPQVERHQLEQGRRVVDWSGHRR